jgi:hypothetical protein
VYVIASLPGVSASSPIASSRDRVLHFGFAGALGQFERSGVFFQHFAGGQ